MLHALQGAPAVIPTLSGSFGHLPATPSIRFVDHAASSLAGASPSFYVSFPSVVMVPVISTWFLSRKLCVGISVHLPLLSVDPQIRCSPEAPYVRQITFSAVN